MAVIEDTLNTVLRLTGAQQYISLLSRVAGAHQALALAQRQQAAAQVAATAGVAAGAGGGPGAALGVGAAAAGLAQAATLAGVYAVGTALKSSTEAAADYERELQRMVAFQREAGDTTPVREMQDFVQSLSETGTASQTEIMKTMDMLARWGITGRHAAQDAMILARSSQAIGVGMSEFASQIQNARRGRARALFEELNIPIKGVTGQLYSYDQMLQLADNHTRAFQIGMQGLPGALDRQARAWENLKTQTGESFAPLTTPWLEGVTNMLRMATADIKALFSGHFRDFFSGAAAYRAIHPELNLPSGGAGGGQTRSERYLRTIAYNTGAQGPLGNATRGGGAFAEPGGGLRLRDMSQMIRRH